MAMKELEKISNSRTNRIIAGFLVAEYIVIFVCNILCWIGMFAPEVWPQLLILLFAGIPGTIVGLLVLLKKELFDVNTEKTILCILLCLQVFATSLLAYSYAGTIVLIIPMILTALYPNSKINKTVIIVMVISSVILPPLVLLADCWDTEYYEFLYMLGIGYDVEAPHTLTCSSTLTIGEQILQAVRYMSVQNILVIGAFAVISRLIYSQTQKSFDNQKEIIRIGETDELTGLLNRNSFERRTELKTDSGTKNVSCFYFDANGLHEMNNKEGHKAGDTMLKFIGEQIQSAFCHENSYRIGGDEFVAFKTDIKPEMLTEIRASLKQKFDENGYHVAIGYAYSETDTDLSTLVKDAEKDMYMEKQIYYTEHDRRRKAR